ncbi:MAG: hypothetical protein R6U54_04330 [Candidatus Omnitrophota bacterium]
MNKIKLIKNIPGISNKYSQKHNFAIHILCSHNSLESCILSLLSFYALSENVAEVVIHEDGTFTKKDKSIIKKLFPWIKHISLAEADKKLKENRFSKETIKLRHRHKLLIKAIDFHYLEPKNRILIIDTDIFFLSNPKELWKEIEQGSEFIFNQDPEPAYGSSKELLEKVLAEKININYYPCVNTGLIVEPSRLLREEKETIENYCQEFENFSYQRKHCIEQGYIACLLKYKNVPEFPLQGRYDIVGHKNKQGIEKILSYDLIDNPENIQTIHLCGWDKLGQGFLAVKEKIFARINNIL